MILYKLLNLTFYWFEKAAESPQKYTEKYMPKHHKLNRTLKTKSKF